MTARSRRRTNQALLALVPLAVATGLFANTIGTEWLVHPAALHGIVALGVVVLAPWKSIVVRSGLRRRSRSVWVSLTLLGLIVITVVTGLLHSAALARKLGPVTVMQAHIGAALAALLLVVFHYRAHPVPIRKTDLSRRSFVRTGAFGLVAVTTWGLWERGLALAGSPGASRRFTGSHARGSFDPAAMPVTSWLDDEVQHIDAATWRVRIDGRAVGLDAIEAMEPEDLTAILDCTSGWYAEQRWSGVRLDRLLATDKRSVDVTSATGYGRRFPTRDLDKLWLVTSAGGAPLSPGHGFPARIVAPGRRGFWWVKWVVAIEPTDSPWWWQLPFPAT